MTAFSLSELNTKIPEQQKSAALSEKFTNTHIYKVESIKQLVGKPPGKDNVYFLWTLQSFNAFTFIPFVFNTTGVIQELYLSTYSINRRIIDALIRFIDKGKILSVYIFISDSIKYRLPLVYDHLQAITMNRSNVVVNYAWNHSKIALARSGDEYYVFEGSGNFSENAQYEQYILTNSKTVYEFRRNCIADFNR